MYKNIKNYVYKLIREDDKNDSSPKIFDVIIIVLIILSIADVVLETFSGLPPLLSTISHYFEIITVLIFTVEYALRVWTTNEKLKYILSPMAIIDFLAILPFYLPFLIPFDLRVLRTLRLIRLLRIFKLNRYISALTAVGKVIKNKSAQLISSISVVLLLMIISSILIFYVENPAQPDVFKNAFSGLWWAVATLTTVGYGDIFPITVFGKLFSAFIAILGIGLVAVPTGIISAGFVEGIDKSEKVNITEYEEDLITLFRQLDFEEKNKTISFILKMKDKISNI
jgi:voltage-gated potassium channel